MEIEASVQRYSWLVFQDGGLDLISRVFGKLRQLLDINGANSEVAHVVTLQYNFQLVCYQSNLC